jgi:hypothetical protein
MAQSHGIIDGKFIEVSEKKGVQTEYVVNHSAYGITSKEDVMFKFTFPCPSLFVCNSSLKKYTIIGWKSAYIEKTVITGDIVAGYLDQNGNLKEANPIIKVFMDKFSHENFKGELSGCIIKVISDEAMEQVKEHDELWKQFIANG